MPGAFMFQNILTGVQLMCLLNVGCALTTLSNADEVMTYLIIFDKYTDFFHVRNASRFAVTDTKRNTMIKCMTMSLLLMTDL